MHRSLATIAALLFAIGLAPARADSRFTQCDPVGTQSSGALYQVCLPALTPWNGQLVVYAHGYVAFNEPLALPYAELALAGGGSLVDVVTLLGFAFATTSYAVNGVSILPGRDDTIELVELFGAAHGLPTRALLVGASSGGAVTALAMEARPDVFQGGLAMCGPYGDFRAQVNYWGDARVLFDTFFPGLIPGSAALIPDEVIADWDSVYVPAVSAALAAMPIATRQLLRVGHIPVDRKQPATIEESIQLLLWYSVFGTNDGVAKLGGQPFDNMSRVYSGSLADGWLNGAVERLAADPAAVDEMTAHYATLGHLPSPLVTMHTTGDPVVPFEQATLYRDRIAAAGFADNHVLLPVKRWGHCNFTVGEVLVAFATLLAKADGTSANSEARAMRRSIAEKWPGFSLVQGLGLGGGR